MQPSWAQQHAQEFSAAWQLLQMTRRAHRLFWHDLDEKHLHHRLWRAPNGPALWTGWRRLQLGCSCFWCNRLADRWLRRWTALWRLHVRHRMHLGRALPVLPVWVPVRVSVRFCSLVLCMHVRGTLFKSGDCVVAILAAAARGKGDSGHSSFSVPNFDMRVVVRAAGAARHAHVNSSRALNRTGGPGPMVAARA